MAANTYTQYHADGTKKIYRRTVKQGRKSLPPELVKVPVTIFVLPVEKEKIESKAKEMNMSVSNYGEIALSLFDIKQFSTVENC